MKGHDQFNFDGRIIKYQIQRSQKRKTIQIKVRGPEVMVTAPAAMPNNVLRHHVEKKAQWIIAKSSQRVPGLTPLLLADGTVLTYMGKEVHLRLENSLPEGEHPQVRQIGDQLLVAVSGPGEESVLGIQKALKKWFSGKAAEYIPGRVKHWWPHYGQGPISRVLIGDQRSRWASCGVDGTLRFNWRLLCFHPDLIDYVVVHELAHLTIRNHSPNFWNLVEEGIPNAKQRQKELRELGRTVPF